VCAASLKRVEQSLRSLEEYGKLVAGDFAAACEQLRYRVYTLEKALDTTRISAEALGDKQLCVLIDAGENESAFVTLVETLVNEGVGLIQLRDKRLADRLLLERARTLVRATRGSKTLAIINDRADLAAAARADGVHLGQDDLAVADARTIVGCEMLIGVSTHSIAQAREAVLTGASYLGAGPTFPSRTKAFDDFPGTDYLRQVAHEVSLPTFAIGGIDAENIPKVIATGIHRIAVSSAVTGAADAGETVRRLQSALGSGPSAPIGG
jgi:thiamine-phosphate pyrophosphorylase